MYATKKTVTFAKIKEEEYGNKGETNRPVHMDTMSYKGFTGSALYSSKDEVFHGKIEGIDPLVNYEGDSVSELKQAFHEAVDYYLDFCKREGIEPRKKYSGTLNVRISPEIHCRIATLASREGISINAFIKRALDNQVAVMEM